MFVPVAADAVDTRSTNLEFEAKEQIFEDIRGREDDFSLDSHGFQTGAYPTRLDSDMFGDKETVETQYFDEVREILRDVEGGYDEVFLFDWRVGCSLCRFVLLNPTADKGWPKLRNAARPKEQDTELDMNDPTIWLRPSPHVHVGQLLCSGVFEPWHRGLIRQQTKVQERSCSESSSISPTRPPSSCRGESAS